MMNQIDQLIYSLEDQVIGSPEAHKRVYELWANHWNLIDRLDEDYHNHFQLHGSKSANAWALQSVAFFILMNTRAIWEESRAVLAYHQAQKNYAAVEKLERLSIPHFIVNVAQQLLPKQTPMEKCIGGRVCIVC